MCVCVCVCVYMYVCVSICRAGNKNQKLIRNFSVLTKTFLIAF